MINSLISAVTTIILFLFPLFYLPITSESYEYNKMVLVIVTNLVLLFFFSLKIANEKKIYLVKNTFGFPLFLLAAIALISTLFVSPNLTVAFTTPLATTTYLSGFILYLLLVFVFALDYISLSQIGTIFIFDALIISVYTIFSFLGIFPNTSFTPAGNMLATAMFLSVIAVYLISNIIISLQSKIPILKTVLNAPSDRFILGGDTAWQKQRNQYKAGVSEKFGIETAGSNGNLIFYSFSLLLISGTAIFLAYHILTVQKPIILPFAYGWAIALEILKNIKTLFLGVGPANFITAFIVGKPLAFNTTPFWNVIFTSSSSFFLNLITETGLINGLLYLFILLKSFKLALSGTEGLLKLPITITLLFSLILQIFLPSSVTLFTLTIILLAICAKKESSSISIKIPFIHYLPLILSIILTCVIIYFGSKIYLAEVYFKQSLDNILNNKPTETYNLQKKAIELVPNMDRYHLVFSQTNLALAQSLASKKDLTDEDKQYLPRLVYQSIDHARTGVTLYRTNIFNWDNLAKTYTALLNYATGADEWAIVSYRQKIALDPLSPSNHLALGNLYKLLNKFDLAGEEFGRAIKLKPDLANAHYQLAIMLKTEKKYQGAYNELKITLALLNDNTPEADTVKKEMDELEKLIPAGLPDGTRPAQKTTSSTSNNSATSTNQTLDIQPTDSTVQHFPTPQSTISFPQPPVTP